MSSSPFRHSLRTLTRASAGQGRSSTISPTAAAGASSSSSCRHLPPPPPSFSSRIPTRLLSTTATTGRTQAEGASSSFSSAGASTSSDATTDTSSSSSTSLPPSLISHIDPAFLPPALKSTGRHHKTLYEHLSTLPNDGVGTKVRQVRWAARGIDVPYGTEFQGPVADPKDRKDSHHLCYWLVTRARLRWVGGEDEGADGEGQREERSDKKRVHGKVWGRLVWRGVPVTPEGQEERIRGGLKFLWDAAR